MTNEDEPSPYSAFLKTKHQYSLLNNNICFFPRTKNFHPLNFEQRQGLFIDRILLPSATPWVFLLIWSRVCETGMRTGSQYLPTGDE